MSTPPRKTKRSSRRSNQVDQTPQDIEAERGVIGCRLYGADDERLDPGLHLFHAGRRLLSLTIDTLKAEGDWQAPAGSLPGDTNGAARANIERIGHAIDTAGGWPVAGSDPRSELRECLDIAAMQPTMIGFYCDRLRKVYLQRIVIETHERRLRAAQAGDLDAALEGTGLALDEAGPHRNGHSSPVLLRLADVTPESVRWLWPGNIACGKLTLIAGDPGLGKSMLSMDLAARVSTGWKWPDGEPVGDAGGVVLLSAEDDPADTIRPRLDAAGADVERITLLQAVRRTDPDSGRTTERTFSLMDLPALDGAIRQTPGCRLVVVDPITAYLGGTDSHKNAEIRGLLAPLSELAQRTGVALVAVTHLNKSSGSPAIYRTMGSLAFAAAARAVWAVTRHPDDPSGKSRLLIPVKNNIGNDQRGFCYEIQNDAHGRPVLAWDSSPVTISADEALAPAKPQDGKPRPSPALDDAVEWLTTALAQGPRPAVELFADAKANGIATATLKRAKAVLKVEATKAGFESGEWHWTSPVTTAALDSCPF